MVVQDAHSAGESELACPHTYEERIFRVLNPGAEDRVDRHAELGVLGEPDEFSIEHFQALLRDGIGDDVVNADLQVIEPGPVQPRLYARA